jgi:PAS domain S-box-containing protein
MKNIILLVVYIAGSVGVIFSFQEIKKEKRDVFLKQSYLDSVESIQDKIQTLLREKSNATKTIALTLVENPHVVDAFQTGDISRIDLEKISQTIKSSTNFKNVWFQLISKDGISLKRSWSDKKGDSLVEAREDIRKLIKDPKTISRIGAGKFDMNFKVIVPIYSKERELLGFFEAMTHFNSIAKRMKDDGVELIILANKSLSNNISNSFTGNGIQDHYIANFSPNKRILEYLNKRNVDELLNTLQFRKFVIEESLRSKISYLPIVSKELDSTSNKRVGHILAFSKINDGETSLNIKMIDYSYTLYTFLAFSFWTLIIYLIYSLKEQKTYETSSRKAVFYLIVLFVTISGLVYELLSNRMEREIEIYLEGEKNQIVNEYNLIYNKNLELANFIFETLISKDDVVKMFENGDREKLYNYLKRDYEELVRLIHVRQVHFHTAESRSFLRMHRPKKYGDSLVGIRESVEFVNKHLDSFDGFEEGRIFNGFRYVFPVFNKKDVHLGSVEVSFDSYSFIESYLKSFGKKASFLLKKDTVDEKVFKHEKRNYVESPIEGFYYDKEIFGILEWNNKRISEFGKLDIFKKARTEVLNGEISVVHFTHSKELIVMFPVINKISGKVVATITISKTDEYIRERKQEFIFTIIVLIAILIFIAIFVYREIILKEEITAQSQRIRRILDSQESIIIISNGTEVLDSNRALLEFFNVKNIKEFNKRYGCICHYFDEKEGYLRKDMGDETWLSYAVKNREQDTKVRIRDWRGEVKVFKLEARSYALKDAYIISLLDITQIEETNLEIKQKHNEQKQLLSLFDIGGISLFRWKNDKNWSVEYLSKNIEEFFGYSRKDFLSGKVRYGEIVLKEDIDHVKHEVQEALQYDKDFFSHKPYRIRRSDGEIRWVLDYTLIIRNDGIATHFLGYIVDITDLKNFEKKARDIKDRFQLAVDGANDGLWDWNLETDEVYFSTRWKEMIGFEDHEVSNSLLEWKSRVHEDDIDDTLKDIESHLKGETKIYENEHRMRHKNGKWVWVLDRGKALFDESGKAIRMVGFHTDVTQKKKYEEKLQKLVEEKTDENLKQWEILQQQSKLAVMGEMMGAIAHQWRQPLNALSINIQGLMDDFEEGLIDEDFVDEYIAKNQNIILFMSKTVEDFRNFFKVDKKRVLFSVREAIENTLDIQIAQLKSHNIVVELKGDDFMVNGFKSEFQQVILNLVGNSKDAIFEQQKQDGVIEVNIFDRTVTVRDNGGGIPEHVLTRIFEPYFTTKEDGKGTGIGLYMSKMIIEDNMEGSLQARNTSYGAEFTIKM